MDEQKTPEKNNGVQLISLPESELKEFIDSKIDFLEGKPFDAEAGYDAPELFEMTQLEKRTSSPLSLTHNVRIERNLIEVPIAIYSGKIKTNWVEFKKGDIETKVGTPDGALTGFDERILWGIIAYRFTEYQRNGKGYYLSYFTTYDVINDLNLGNSGAVRQQVKKSIEKIGGLMIKYKNFRVMKESGKQTINIRKQYPVFKYTETADVKDEKHEKSYHVFIWNDMFCYNFVNQYVKYIPKQRFIDIPDDLMRRTWIYLSCKLGNQPSYSENLPSLIARVGITTKSNKTRAVKILKDKLDYLIAKKDLGSYRIKNDILTVYPVRKYPDLQQRILDWLYGDVFNNWVRAPKPQMINKINTLIKNYGDSRIEELFLNAAEHRADPHPSHFIESIKQLETTEEPITEQLTPGEIAKMKEKAGL